MHHHVITRFNIRSRLLYDDSWFVHRLGLFEKYTLPSMERQTNTNFTWHILFDRERTEAHMDKVENLKRSNGFISLHFFEKDDRPITHLAKQISAREEPLLTTRIDNDDIAHPDYVQLIQNAASRALERGIESPEIIDFKRFYCWSPDERKMSCRSPSYPSAFISLIEPPSPIRLKTTVYCGKHSVLHEKYTMKKIQNTGAIAVVHGKNSENNLGLHPNVFRRVHNRIRRKAVELSATKIDMVLAEFGILEGVSF